MVWDDTFYGTVSPGNDRRNRVCSDSDGSTITIFSNKWNLDEEWFISENHYGTCETKVSRQFDTFLYPGDRCRGADVVGTCVFGTKMCNLYNRCDGVTAYGYCKNTLQCNIGAYCNEDGLCLDKNEIGEQCTTHDSCVDIAMWFYNTPEQTYGICVQTVSQDERELANPEYNDEPVAQADMERLCTTGMVNSTTGRCASLLKSLNKGQVCTTSADCPTTDDNVFAKWKWGYNSNGDKYWDIEAGDVEWVNAKNLFSDYNGECGKSSGSWSSYKCAQIKAQYYVELLNNPTCLKQNYAQHPAFWEYQRYWSAWSVAYYSFIAFVFTIIFLME